MQETLTFILEFLHKHQFSKAEAALKSELTVRGIGEITLPLSRANSGVSELGGLLSRASSGLDSANLLFISESEIANGLSMGNGLVHGGSSGSTPSTAPPASPPGDIPQGLPPVRVRSFELRGSTSIGNPSLAADLEEAREDFVAAKSVVSLSAVPPALQIAEPVSGPARSNRPGGKEKEQAYGCNDGVSVGGKSVRSSGEPATEPSTAVRKDSFQKTPLPSKGEEPVSLEHARELLLGLAISGESSVPETGVHSPRHLEDWDSDEYEDEDDPGYHRQPIEDEEAFLANEIDVPSDEEDGTRGHSAEIEDRERKDEAEGVGDNPSFSQEEAYFSGEEYYRFERGQDDAEGESAGHDRERGNDYKASRSADVEDIEYEFPTTSPAKSDAIDREPTDGPSISGAFQDSEFPSVCSVGGDAVGEAGLFGEAVVLELRQKIKAGGVEGVDVDLVDLETEAGRDNMRRLLKQRGLMDGEGQEAGALLDYFEDEFAGVQGASGGGDGHQEAAGNTSLIEDGGFGFSFPEPLSGENTVTLGTLGSMDSGGLKTVWSVGDLSPDRVTPEDPEDRLSGMEDVDDMLAGWRRSGTTSPALSPKEEEIRFAGHAPAGATVEVERVDSGAEDAEEEDEDEGAPQSEGYNGEDDEDAAVHEQIQRMKAEEEQFETFDLRIIHRKNRTGFEEDKDFPVMLNTVIAGRYHVTEYLGSAAFSKAIQAHDLHTGMDVCMKIIKNNKDFFDQSLDEIKLLKYINRHDPADEHHVLRLYDYFYHREHLFIVCELLRANLYEFHKYNRESGGEVYFTMARIQSITVQCLEALAYIHQLGLIHCDLKPENILVKSYSRCEIKVIDLGSSCFQTDHLCSYVQSRSYRAPEVILGLPYEQKIDIWSLGCILAELCSGNVLFQNDSLVTLLARVIGILGPIDPAMLAKGRDTHKYFTKSYMLYERNPELDRLEYLIPKKSSLRHRLPTGDPGFTEFVAALLEINPEKRPTAKEALQHPWLQHPYERDW